MNTIPAKNLRFSGFTAIAFLMLFTVNLLQADSLKDHKTPATTLQMINPSGEARADAAFWIDLKQLNLIDSGHSPDHLLFRDVATGLPVESQVIDRNGNGELDSVLLICDLEADSEIRIEPYFDPVSARARTIPNRVQAEISRKTGGHWKEGKPEGDPSRGNHEYVGGHFINVQHLDVPAEHSDHSWFIRYEGPGIESELVGYRLYLDWRTGMDIFGKKTGAMILQEVGQDGFSSYHEMSYWGMDILKVGNALGIGSFGYFDGNQAHRVSEFSGASSTILASGPIFAAYRNRYSDWVVDDFRTDLEATVSMVAGSRLAHVELQSGNKLSNFSTGIVKEAGVKVFQGDAGMAGNATSMWTFLATYGAQSLDGSNLGMAIIYRESDALRITEDGLNHLVVLQPDKSNRVDYYFLAAWEGEEPAGIKSRDAFLAYLNAECLKLAQPGEIRFLP